VRLTGVGGASAVTSTALRIPRAENDWIGGYPSTKAEIYKGIHPACQRPIEFAIEISVKGKDKEYRNGFLVTSSFVGKCI
jgi:hypothetical protein